MLKLITATFLLLAFASQTFYKAFIVFDYKANTNAYAKNCVNKARPKMHCKGQCQMMKKLQEEEKKDAQNAERKAQNQQENVLSSKSFFTSIPTFFTNKEKIHYDYLIDGKATKMPRAYFHPPTA